MKSSTDTSPNFQSLNGQSKFLIPPTERRQFIFLFTLLTGLSFFIGIQFANSTYNPIKNAITGTFFEAGLIWGAVVGTAQWLSLRKYSFDKNWIVVTALGCGFSYTLPDFFLSRLGAAGYSVSVFLPLWLGFAAQSFALNHYVRRSWMWIFISLLPAFIAASLWAALIPVIPWTDNDFSFYGINLLVVKLSQGLILGGISAAGLCLFYRINQSKSPVNSEEYGYMTRIFPEKLGRVRYFCYHLIWIGVLMGVIYPLIGPSVLNIGVIGFKLFLLDVPRIRSIGWSPWTVLLMLIPGLNALMQLLLLGLPADFFIKEYTLKAVLKNVRSRQRR